MGSLPTKHSSAVFPVSLIAIEGSLFIQIIIGKLRLFGAGRLIKLTAARIDCIGAYATVRARCFVS